MSDSTIVIVDDNPADVELIRDAFIEVGIAAAIHAVPNGIQALALLERVRDGSTPRPAAVLLDLNMPRVHGKEVLSFIKGNIALAAIPTIVLTSSYSPSDRSECLGLGADAFYTKANTLDELNDQARKIGEMIERGPHRHHFHPPASGTASVVNLLSAAIQTLARPRLLLAR